MFKDGNAELAVVQNKVIYGRRQVAAAHELISICPLPTSSGDSIAASLIHQLNSPVPGHDVQAFNCRSSMMDIVQRIGHNAVLSTTLSAFTTVNKSLAYGRISLDAVSKYNKALHAMYRSLSNPKTAYMADTVYAMFLLMVCQAFMDSHACGIHLEGMLPVAEGLVRQGKTDAFTQDAIFMASVMTVGLDRQRNGIQLTVLDPAERL